MVFFVFRKNIFSSRSDLKVDQVSIKFQKQPKMAIFDPKCPPTALPLNFHALARGNIAMRSKTGSRIATFKTKKIFFGEYERKNWKILTIFPNEIFLPMKNFFTIEIFFSNEIFFCKGNFFAMENFFSNEFFFPFKFFFQWKFF